MSEITLQLGPLRPPEQRFLRRLPFRFLLLALVLHVGVLTLPVALRPVSPPASNTIQISLQKPEEAKEMVVPVEPSREVQAVDSTPPALEQIEAPETPPEATSGPAEPPSAVPEETQENSPQITVDALLSSVRAMDWSEPERTERMPGRTTNSALLKRWEKPVIPSRDYLLADEFAPSETEIVDRWQSPSGVHQVVVRLPNGKTMCGRQEAANDMRPWLQMPMMFGSCAGGGKRKKSARR